jgi:hypothetical protein
MACEQDRLLEFEFAVGATEIDEVGFGGLELRTVPCEKLVGLNSVCAHLRETSARQMLTSG